MILVFLILIALLCLSGGLADWVLQDADRPRVRVRMLLRMFWLARQNWGIVLGWRVARMFEKATRPKKGG